MTALDGPTFLVIGAARSGSTLLAELLGSHPDIHFSHQKEPHFLAIGAHDVHFTGPGDDLVDSATVRDEETWRALFRCDRTVTARGEGSVSTLAYPARSIIAIETFCPDVRLVVLLRHPAARARSAYGLVHTQGFETETFAGGLEREAERLRAGYQFIWGYRSQSMYAQLLAPFVERFGDRLLVVEFEQFVADPQTHFDRICTHIGVGRHLLGEVRQVNASAAARVPALRRRAAAMYANPRRRAVVQRLVPAAVRRRIRAVTTKPAGDDLPDGFVESFGDELADLHALLGAQAPTWARPSTGSPEP